MRLTLGALVLLPALAACGGGDASEDPAALEDAAQEQADRFASGDFAGAWDMWTDDAKAVMSQADYVTFGEACANGGVPLDVVDARVDAPGEGTVRVGLGGISGAYQMRYEDGAWSWVPSDEALAMYELGPEGAIEQATDDGSCVEP